MVGVLQGQAGQHPPWLLSLLGNLTPYSHQDQGNRAGLEDLVILVVLWVLQLLEIRVLLVGH